MRSDESFYETKTCSLYDFFALAGERKTGFQVPSYQRNYDWGDEDIDRLLDSCFGEFNSLNKNGENKKHRQSKKISSTYLGGVILVKNHKKSKHDLPRGESVLVIDGQQRITTILLTMCGLMQEIRNLAYFIKFNNQEMKNLINDMIDNEIAELYDCIVGKMQSEKGFFPRIVRDIDHRALSSNDLEYNSAIGLFLYQFLTFFHPDMKYNADNNEFTIDVKKFFKRGLDRQKQLSAIKKKYKRICSKLKSLYIKPEDFEDDKDFAPLNGKDINKKEILDLFDHYRPDDSLASYISTEALEEEINLLIILLFSIYLKKHVLLTKVVVDDEDMGFDVFDALNTTGQPLTALETLKHQVVKHVGSKYGEFSKSPAFESYREIDKNLDFKSAEEKQATTKEALISFSYYLTGKKLSKDLKTQRKALKNMFENTVDEKKEDFVREVSNVVEFRKKYWNAESIGNSQEFDNLTKICYQFIYDSKTDLSIPLMARYQISDKENFHSAIKATAAFIILRRSITNGTSGIDNDLRTVMAEPKNSKNGKEVHGDGLCLGLTQDNKLLTVSEFKKALIKKLKNKFSEFIKDSAFPVENGDWWIRRIIRSPIANNPNHFAKFLLLAAHHRSTSNPCCPGFLISTRDKRYDTLTHDSWIDKSSKTVEHIAPSTKPIKGWKDSIYESDDTRHTIGNLTLLPLKINSSLGNESWDEKKKIYLVAAEEDIDSANKIISDNKISKKRENLILRSGKLPMLDPIIEVIRKNKEWDLELINNRSRNIAKLAWNQISLWLFEKPREFTSDEIANYFQIKNK